MSKIDEAKRGLKLFESEPAVKKVRDQLKSFERKQLTKENEISDLRSSLLQLSRAPFTLMHDKLIFAVHMSLFVLARNSPLNEVDEETKLPICPITLQRIVSDQQVVTSTGYIFSMDGLVGLMKYRRKKDDNLINPLTRQAFSALDKAYIEKKTKELRSLEEKKKGRYPMEDKFSPPSLFQLFFANNHSYPTPFCIGVHSMIPFL